MALTLLGLLLAWVYKELLGTFPFPFCTDGRSTCRVLAACVQGIDEEICRTPSFLGLPVAGNRGSV